VLSICGSAVKDLWKRGGLRFHRVFGLPKPSAALCGSVEAEYKKLPLRARAYEARVCGGKIIESASTLPHDRLSRITKHFWLWKRSSTALPQRFHTREER